MFTQESCIEYINRFILRLKTNGLSINKAILYGSYAKNEQNEISDNDLALVSDEFTGVGFLNLKLIYKELYDYEKIQPKTYKTEYFTLGDRFIEEILKTDIILN